MEAARRLGLAGSASRAPLPSPSAMWRFYSGCCCVSAGAISGFSRAAISRWRGGRNCPVQCLAQDPALRVCDPVRDHHGGGAFQIDDDSEFIGAPFLFAHSETGLLGSASMDLGLHYSATVAVSTGAISALVRPHCFHWNNLGLPVFCKEIVERLGEQILNSGVAVSSENAQLLLHRRRKITRDIALAFSARPEVRTLGCGR